MDSYNKLVRHVQIGKWAFRLGVLLLVLSGAAVLLLSLHYNGSEYVPKSYMKSLIGVAVLAAMIVFGAVIFTDLGGSLILRKARATSES